MASVQGALDHTTNERPVDTAARDDAIAHALSHDVRALFRSTAGFAQAVQMQAAGRLENAEVQQLQRVIDASQRGARTLEAIVAWLRLPSRPLQPVSLDLGFVLDWAVSEFPADSFAITTDFQAPLMADEALFKHVLGALLANARAFAKAADLPATVRVATRREGDAVVLSFDDDGIGFDPALAHKLGQPFVRLHGSEHGAGTGLGLACVKSIVDRHGGTLQFESAVGAGARVRIHMLQPVAA